MKLSPQERLQQSAQLQTLWHTAKPKGRKNQQRKAPKDINVLYHFDLLEKDGKRLSLDLMDRSCQDTFLRLECSLIDTDEAVFSRRVDLDWDLDDVITSKCFRSRRRLAKDFFDGFVPKAILYSLFRNKETSTLLFEHQLI